MVVVRIISVVIVCDKSNDINDHDSDYGISIILLLILHLLPLIPFVLLPPISALFSSFPGLSSSFTGKKGKLGSYDRLT